MAKKENWIGYLREYDGGGYQNGDPLVVSEGLRKAVAATGLNDGVLVMCVAAARQLSQDEWEFLECESERSPFTVRLITRGANG